MAALLAYPGADHIARATALRDGVSARCAAAADAIDRHLERVQTLSPRALEEVYTRTFDLQPACAPYLSVHLFGEESPRRANLMTGLAAAWERLDVNTGGELADHVAVVLEHGPRLPDGEWGELVHHALLPALGGMTKALDAAASPYAALCQASTRLLEEVVHV